MRHTPSKHSKCVEMYCDRSVRGKNQNLPLRKNARINLNEQEKVSKWHSKQKGI